MSLSTVTERVPLGRAGPKFAPVPVFQEISWGRGQMGVVVLVRLSLLAATGGVI